MTQEEIKAIIRQEIPEIPQDREMRDDYDSGVGALGAIWGKHSEESFGDALKAILEESFGVQVINVTEYDDEGEVFGRPDQIELDLLIKNGLLIIGEIQSSISKSTILSAATPTRIQLQDSYFTDGRFQGAGNS
ncbi:MULTISPECIES: DUF3782 domain-containing protein [unclassified Microcystis]|uniref:DUF3782 domain-containing protein n=1 Tax=unclassified Microcystis TaxID=2643300 RepID=UPI0025857419|nr:MULTISPECIES: DUF3782 domain-containing protein [unclassified Microcystis]